MLAVPGYAGFRRSNVDVDLLAEEVQTSDRDRHNKFTRAASDVVYGRPPEALGATSKTLNGGLGKDLKPTDYKVPQKKGVLHRQPMEKRFIHKTTHASAFPDYMAQVFELRDHTEEEYKDAFDRIDRDGSGFIVGDEIRYVLREVLGKEATDHQVRTFVGTFDTNKDGRVSWEEFRKGLGKATDHMLRSTKGAASAGVTKSGAPSWAPQPKPKVIGDGIRLSSQQMDVGEYGHDPRKRALVDGTGMGGTTKDLYAGTSKVSVHLPGYAGYMAESTYARNATATAQSKGARPRDTFNTKTNLDQTFNRRMPGYTGHMQQTNPARTMTLRKPTGQFAATEAAAADAMVTKYWEARAAAAKK